MLDNIRKIGAKSNYSLSDEIQSIIKESLKNNPMDTPEKLIWTMRKISYPGVSTYEKLRENIKENNFSLWEYFGSSVMGDKGQVVGTASPQESLDIRTHQVIRQRLDYFIYTHLVDFFKCVDSFDEAKNIDAIVKTCKSPHISQGRRVLWAMGIVEMMKNNYIAAVHILMPQIEHALLKKAEYYCGPLTKLEREDHQDEPSLKGILIALKPYLKVPLYNEFEYFFNSGADGNVRNKLAHGLCEIEEIMSFAPYLWWLAIKMYWCDEELFIEKSINPESNESDFI